MDITQVGLVDHQAFMESVRDRAPARTAEEIRAAFERFVVSEERILADLKRLTISELMPLARPLYTGKRKGDLVDMAWGHLVDEFAWFTVGGTQMLTKTYEVFSGSPRDELADVRQLAIYLDARDARVAQRKAEFVDKLREIKSRQASASTSAS